MALNKAEFFFSFLRDKTNLEKFIAFAGTAQSLLPTFHQAIEARERVPACYLSIRAFTHIAFNINGDLLTRLSKKNIICKQIKFDQLNQPWKPNIELIY